MLPYTPFWYWTRDRKQVAILSLIRVTRIHQYSKGCGHSI